MDTDLSEIREVIETTSTSEVNTFLKNGWKLIDTYQTIYSSESDDKVVMYILGKSEPCERGTLYNMK